MAKKLSYDDAIAEIKKNISAKIRNETSKEEPRQPDDLPNWESWNWQDVVEEECENQTEDESLEELVMDLSSDQSQAAIVYKIIQAIRTRPDDWSIHKPYASSKKTTYFWRDGGVGLTVLTGFLGKTILVVGGEYHYEATTLFKLPRGHLKKLVLRHINYLHECAINRENAAREDDLNRALNKLDKALGDTFQ